MIVLDTNVLSELMKSRPQERVIRWVAAQPTPSLYTTSITPAEILHCLMLLATGRRRNSLEAAASDMFREDFPGRVLPFCSQAAALYAEIAVHRSRAGRPISQFDAQIAAIARSAGAFLATRNTWDFEDCGLRLLDPWNEPVA